LANEKKEKGKCGEESPLEMVLFKRIKTLGSFLLQSGENSVCEVRVDGENLAIDYVVRVVRENLRNSSAKPRALLKLIVSNRNKLFTCTLRCVKLFKT